MLKKPTAVNAFSMYLINKFTMSTFNSAIHLRHSSFKLNTTFLKDLYILLKVENYLQDFY